ncbi:prenylcysteine oxidase 1-like [Phymastichus coffea]|uniref:prenylcysteine oxidase 1-like n=1 Tax=Phymastichus coffea TaxID=108790 RepID=UPI00273B2099|nr:prenylcysteine oxidase 1-like [Phymastichus coffea]
MLQKKLLLLFFLFRVISFKNVYCSQICRPKVAIIGAGIGGASASYFLTELFDKNIDIDIFESNIVGGRLATVKFGNKEFEAGGAIIHPRNKYMQDFVKLLNLNTTHSNDLLNDDRFGIWNGKELVVQESNYQILTLIRLIYRYGLQPFYLHRYVDSIMDDFEKIYSLQDKGIGFENVTALIGAMNQEFVNLLQTSMKDHLIKLNYHEKIINELVEATLVVNYGQDTNVQSFVGCVSVAGAGTNLWAVNGGNKQVPELLIYKNKQISLIHSIVKRIDRIITDNTPKYELFYHKKNEDQLTTKIYDIVIIAAPMTSDQESPITFNNFQNSNLKFTGDYQVTYATFIKGNANFSYFGLDEEIRGILSCNPKQTIISSISRLSSVDNKQNNQMNIWKIFSREKINKSLINKLFRNVDEVKEKKWKAYPSYSTVPRLDKFKIDNYMYYLNAIEWAASAMEMSAVGGRNVAILAFNDYKERCSSLKEHKSNDFNEGNNSHSSEL